MAAVENLGLKELANKLKIEIQKEAAIRKETLAKQRKCKHGLIKITYPYGDEGPIHYQSSAFYCTDCGKKFRVKDILKRAKVVR